MPIDLKWVRQDPHQVRGWQTLRRRRSDLVDIIVRKDELGRKKLQILEDYKRSLNRLQHRLKPVRCNINTRENGKKQPEPDQSPLSSSNRQDLIKEKKLLEEKIKEAEILWKDSFKDAQKTLCKLASPVGKVDDTADIETICTDILPSLLSSSSLSSSSLRQGTYTRSRLGMDLEQAWKQYTLRHFATYPWVELPEGVPVTRRQQYQQAMGGNSCDVSSFSIDPDSAHALWGCCDDYKNDLKKNCDLSPSSLSTTSCPICNVAISSKDDPIVMLPTWIRLLTELLPNKSIWGDKELPRYTALWSRSNTVASTQMRKQQQQQISDNVRWLGRSAKFKSKEEKMTHSFPSSSDSFSLELVAITAPSLVDAREIQNKLANELSTYYASLLMDEGHHYDQSSGRVKNKLLRRVVAASNLNCHEWSRVEIHVQIQSKFSSTHNNQNSIETLCLGWVSHWGDAASRACDMAFAGGGVARVGGKSRSNRGATKEYVHVIQASVVDSLTWNNILFANCSIDFSRRKMLHISKALLPHLIRPLPREKQSVDGDCESKLEDVLIFLEELVVDSNSSTKKKNQPVFGMQDHTYKQQSAIASTNRKVVTRDTITLSSLRETPIFPPFSFHPSISEEELQQRIRGEKLSCPFNFLFNS